MGVFVCIQNLFIFWGAGVVIRIVERKTIMRLIEEAVAAAGESVAAVGAAAVVAAEES